MGMAPFAHVVFTEHCAISPTNPNWANRDRFILSNGHACALQYTMLHLLGFPQMTVDQCSKFRQLGSYTPGHPENFVTDGIEVSTGPLGQGISNAVGLAMGEAHMAATFNTEDVKLVDHFTYVFCGDGCLQEGVSGEACSLAGHLGLGKLIVLYDDNSITIDGDTSLSFTEDVAKRYESYGWQVLTIEEEISEVSALDALRAKLEEAKACTDKPTMIKIKTLIGWGSAKANTHSVHGAPLGSVDLANVKEKYGLDPKKMFQVDDDVKALYASVVSETEKKVEAWNALFAEYTKKYPDLAAEYTRRMKSKIDVEEIKGLPLPDNKSNASRKHGQACLNAVAGDFPELIGGSADLTPSNLTALKCSGDFQKDTPQGRYIRFGVREHGMAAICNGLFAYGGLRPFCATFFNFAGYALGAIRLSALSRFGVIYIMTHDTIGLGEDGPTHQPVEMFESLRSMPNIHLWRPADAVETSAAYASALKEAHTPSVLCLSRQTLPALDTSSYEKSFKGGYVLSCPTTPDKLNLVLIGTGSELGFCVDAAKILNESGILTRVVTMPCVDLFEEQDEEYKASVLPSGVPTLSVEASAVHGWHKYSHAQIAMTRFGASAPYKDLAVKFGFTVDNVVSRGKELVAFYKGRSAPALGDRPVFINVQAGAGDH